MAGTAIYTGSFTTLDVTAPVISAISSGTPTGTGATITWTTNEPSDSEVEWDTDAGVPYANSSGVNGSLVTSHSVALTGLPTGTVIHFRVKSRDAASNLQVSVDLNFNTSPDSTPPVVSNVSIVATDTTITVSCTTNENATLVVNYGPTNSYGASTSATPAGTSHTVTIPGRTPNTVYHLQLVATDLATNAATGTDNAVATKWGPTLHGASLLLSVEPWKETTFADGDLYDPVTDQSGHAYSLAGGGGVVNPHWKLVQSGERPGAYFDGGDRISSLFANSAGLRVTGDRTWIIVFKTAMTTDGRFVSYHDGSAVGYTLGIGQTTPGIIALYHNTGGFKQSLGPAWNDNRTYVIFASISGTTETLKVNGITYDVFTSVASGAATSGNFYIGTDPSFSAGFLGPILGVHLVNRVLTADEEANWVNYYA